MTIRKLIGAVLLVFGLTIAPRAEDYSLRVESDGEELVVFELSVNADAATVKIKDAEDFVENYDLKDQRWQDDQTKEWFTLAQCEKWAEQTAEKSKVSLNSAPEKIRAFAEWTLDPQYETTVTDDLLTMKSGQVDYKVTFKKSDRDLTNYFRYLRLNAYKNAMRQKNILPFAELKVIDELEKRKLMPTSMEIAIPAIEGSPLIKMTIEEK
jgi:hypothetical protein